MQEDRTATARALSSSDILKKRETECGRGERLLADMTARDLIKRTTRVSGGYQIRDYRTQNKRERRKQLNPACTRVSLARTKS